MPDKISDEARKRGAALQKYRRKAKIRQDDMAEHLGISLATYRRYESGESDIPMSILMEICEELHINVYMLAPEKYQHQVAAGRSKTDADFFQLKYRLGRLPEAMSQLLLKKMLETVEGLIAIENSR